MITEVVPGFFGKRVMRFFFAICFKVYNIRVTDGDVSDVVRSVFDLGIIGHKILIRRLVLLRKRRRNKQQH
jgi:hypothetical protein